MSSWIAVGAVILLGVWAAEVTLMFLSIKSLDRHQQP